MDWLVFYLPLGALHHTDWRISAFGSEGGPDSLTWRTRIDDWLAAIGLEIYERVDFHLALIGFEESGNAYARDLKGVEERWAGYLLPQRGKLRYEPANR